MAVSSDEISELFAKAVTVSGVVGAQLSIIKEGKQFDFVHGFANAELGIPMTKDTVVQIGSATKVFNAMMIMTLVEEGKLDLDVPVRGYIPEFEVSDPQASQSITLRHLLSMSAGIDNGDYKDFGAGEDAISKRVAALRTLPQHFAPGSSFGYSNAGTDISGHVAERVTGKIWDDVLRERILDPAGLKNAVSLDRERVFQRTSVGHVREPGTGAIKVIRRWGVPRGLAPAGSTLTASAHDLARFGHLFISKGVVDSGARVLTENSIQTMMTPQIDVPVYCTAKSWCLGPCMNEWSGIALWGHPGGNISGGSYVYWVPEKKGVMAWTINTVSARPRFERVMTPHIMKAAFGVVKPESSAPEIPIGIDAQRYVGRYAAVDGQCLVEMADKKLIMTRRWKDFADEAVDVVDTVSLTPLGGDRFLINKGDAADPLELPSDTAFFGEDERGRATNMLNFVFPCSRAG